MNLRRGFRCCGLKFESFVSDELSFSKRVDFQCSGSMVNFPGCICGGGIITYIISKCIHAHRIHGPGIFTKPFPLECSHFSPFMYVNIPYMDPMGY